MTDAAEAPTVEWTIEGGDAEPSDQLVASIARLLLSLDAEAEGQEQEEK